jgi:leucyl-tRNA synthetase
VINPDQYMAEWGADAFRLYLMALGPYEQGGDFRDAGIVGPKKFLDRLWLSAHAAAVSKPDTGHGAGDPHVLRKLHQTIKKVGEDIPRLSYNTAISAMMEYMNVLRAGERAPRCAEVLPLVQLVAPFAPHIAEELWELLGGQGSVLDGGWPPFDPKLAAEDEVELAVQVDGKLRATIRISKTITQDDALRRALATPEVAKWVTEEVKKVVFVPGRLLSLVVKGKAK